MAPLEINKIREILPHSYPFLLIDRVISIKEEEIIGIKNVTINEPFFRGHFPDEPVFPGVFQVEALAQLGAIKVIYERDLIGKKNSVYFISIDQVKFRRKVVPGDQLKLVISARATNSNRLSLKGTIFVEDTLACSATIGAIIRHEE